MKSQNNDIKLKQFGGQIPPTTQKAAKLFSVKKGVSMNDFYNAAILEYIERHKDEVMK